MKANETYKKRRQGTLDKLQELHRLLCEEQDAQQARTPQHWTHSEELAYLNSKLDELIKWMGG